MRGLYPNIHLQSFLYLQFPGLRIKNARIVALLFVLFLFVFFGDASAQKEPTASEVLTKLRNEFDKINDYSAQIHIVVNMPGVKVPPMDARIHFKKPNQFHIDADGFAMLPRDVISFNPAFLSEEYFDAVLQGEEEIGGVRCFKMKLLAKSDTIRLQRIMLHVDPNRWVIMKMTTDPAHGGSAEASIAYTRIDMKYYLPSKISLEMTVPSTGFRRRKSQEMNNDQQKEKGTATVTVTYSDYKVNKGIPDSIFKEKAK